METISIVTTSNDDYAKSAAFMLTSLLEKKSANPIDIYVIGGKSEKNYTKSSIGKI